MPYLDIVFSRTDLTYVRSVIIIDRFIYCFMNVSILRVRFSSFMIKRKEDHVSAIKSRRAILAVDRFVGEFDKVISREKILD